MNTGRGGVPLPSNNGWQGRSQVAMGSPQVDTGPRGFFEITPDLGGTRFGEHDLEGARGVYRDLFQRLEIEGWPANPVGPLRISWTQEVAQSACFLIHLARVFYDLSRNFTSRSEPIFYEKVKALFAEQSDSVFAERMAELEVAFILSHAMSPISFEPMVPAELIGSANQPKSPDFGFRLPSGDIAIEVTVWHWQALRDWDAAQGEVSVRLRARLGRAGLSRQVEIGLPLHVQGADIEAIASTDVVKLMRDSTGETTIKVFGGEATLRWAEIPVFASFEEMVAQSSDFADGLGMGVIGDAEKPFGFSVHPIFSEGDIGEAAISLRKALDRKRRQAVEGMPNIIALGLGHHRLAWSWVLQLIVDRVWPNPKYKWITALAAYAPERAWDQPDATAMINFEWNPNAATPAPQPLRDVAEGGATFHLR